MLNGEIAGFIETLEFKSKKDLLQTLRTMRNNTISLSKTDRLIVKPMIGIAIQQAYHTPERELLKYAKSRGVI